MNEVHYSSKSRDWETPNSVFKPLQKEFNIVLDVCATEQNTKCPSHFDIKSNGLKRSWKISKELSKRKAACWMNPPYGKEVGLWVKKAHDEAIKNSESLANPEALDEYRARSELSS